MPGQSVTFTAYVGADMDGPPPSGTLQWADGQVDLGTFPIQLGQSSITTVMNQAGTHSIFAAYSGDTNYCAAMVRFGQFVDRFVLTVSATSSTSTSVFGQPVTYAVQVAPAPPPGVARPTGQVEFFEGSTDLGGVPLTAGNTASFTLSSLAAGSHMITAVYTGDTNYYLVRSAPLSLTVTRAQTAALLTETSNDAQVIFTAKVSPAPPGSGTPTGSVQFMDSTANRALGSANVTTGTASVVLSASQLATAAGHLITAVYSGDANFLPTTSNGIGVPSLIDAAGAPSPTFAAGELVSLFGSNLASTTLQGSSVPLTTSLGAYGVTVTDSAGAVRAAGLYLVSPGQINFVIPAGTAPGSALVTVTDAGATSGSSAIPIQISIAAVAPGLFSASANGKGLAAAQIVRVHADGSQTLENVSSTPINMGSDTLYLVLYASGVRNRSSLANVSCNINGLALPVTYAGAQTQYPGLDQVDVLLPASMKGAGQVNLSLTVDGQTSNTVSLTFQ